MLVTLGVSFPPLRLQTDFWARGHGDQGKRWASEDKSQPAIEVHVAGVGETLVQRSGEVWPQKVGRSPEGKGSTFSPGIRRVYLPP